jgi:hypothetical protein
MAIEMLHLAGNECREATTPANNICSEELLDRVLTGRQTKERTQLAVWPEPGDDSL